MRSSYVSATCYWRLTHLTEAISRLRFKSDSSRSRVRLLVRTGRSSLRERYGHEWFVAASHTRRAPRHRPARVLWTRGGAEELGECATQQRTIHGRTFP